MPNRKASFDSAPVRLLVFFLENPHEELDSPDVKLKFNLRTGNLKQSMQGGVDLGFFARRGAGPGNRVTYMAGPRLLQALRVGGELVGADAVRADAVRAADAAARG